MTVSGWVRAAPAVFVLIWSTGFIVARYGMPHAPPMSFLALRYALSLACFVLWIVWSRPAWPRGQAQWWHLAVVGSLMHAGYLGGVFSAIKLGMGAGTAALLVGLQPVLTVLWVGAITRGTGTVTPRQVLGVVLGFSGLALVVGPKVSVQDLTLAALLLAVFALGCITVGTLYQKHHVRDVDARTASFVQLLGALAVSLPFALWETEPMVWNAALIGAMAWAVLGLTVGAGCLLFLLIQRGAATRVTSLFFLVPPCTATLGWWLFDEPMPWTTLVGMAVTVTGVALVVRQAAATPPPQPSGPARTVSRAP